MEEINTVSGTEYDMMATATPRHVHLCPRCHLRLVSLLGRPVMATSLSAHCSLEAASMNQPLSVNELAAAAFTRTAPYVYTYACQWARAARHCWPGGSHPEAAAATATQRPYCAAVRTRALTCTREDEASPYLTGMSYHNDGTQDLWTPPPQHADAGYYAAGAGAPSVGWGGYAPPAMLYPPAAAMYYAPPPPSMPPPPPAPPAWPPAAGSGPDVAAAIEGVVEAYNESKPVFLEALQALKAALPGWRADDCDALRRLTSDVAELKKNDAAEADAGAGSDASPTGSATATTGTNDSPDAADASVTATSADAAAAAAEKLVPHRTVAEGTAPGGKPWYMNVKAGYTMKRMGGCLAEPGLGYVGDDELGTAPAEDGVVRVADRNSRLAATSDCTKQGKFLLPEVLVEKDAMKKHSAYCLIEPIQCGHLDCLRKLMDEVAPSLRRFIDACRLCSWHRWDGGIDPGEDAYYLLKHMIHYSATKTADSAGNVAFTDIGSRNVGMYLHAPSTTFDALRKLLAIRNAFAHTEHDEELTALADASGLHKEFSGNLRTAVNVELAYDIALQVLDGCSGSELTRNTGYLSSRVGARQAFKAAAADADMRKAAVKQMKCGFQDLQIVTARQRTLMAKLTDDDVVAAARKAVAEMQLLLQQEWVQEVGDDGTWHDKLDAEGNRVPLDARHERSRLARFIVRTYVARLRWFEETGEEGKALPTVKGAQAHVGKWLIAYRKSLDAFIAHTSGTAVGAGTAAAAASGAAADAAEENGEGARGDDTPQATDSGPGPGPGGADAASADAGAGDGGAERGGSGDGGGGSASAAGSGGQ